MFYGLFEILATSELFAACDFNYDVAIRNVLCLKGEAILVHLIDGQEYWDEWVYDCSLYPADCL